MTLVTLFLCTAVGVFQILLRTWVQSSFLRLSKKATVLLALLPPDYCPLLFLSFFFIFVVGVPQHEKHKYEWDDEVGSIDTYEG